MNDTEQPASAPEVQPRATPSPSPFPHPPIRHTPIPPPPVRAAVQHIMSSLAASPSSSSFFLILRSFHTTPRRLQSATVRPSLSPFPSPPSALSRPLALLFPLIASASPARPVHCTPWSRPRTPLRRRPPGRIRPPCLVSTSAITDPLPPREIPRFRRGS
ncbi:hypothetical protein F4802DRAFT_42315 [Xylaria palmicola]|nr:hypothetical protein F4802DRAFT_42315 [Xylaria palmicola]